MHYTLSTDIFGIKLYYELSGGLVAYKITLLVFTVGVRVCKRFHSLLVKHDLSMKAHRTLNIWGDSLHLSYMQHCDTGDSRKNFFFFFFSNSAFELISALSDGSMYLWKKFQLSRKKKKTFRYGIKTIIYRRTPSIREILISLLGNP